MRALNKRKNRNVAFYLLNKRGFTLIEMLLSLSLFSLILIYFIHTVPLLTYHAYSDEIIEQMEWEIFLNQAKRELFSSKNISISTTKSI